VFIRVHSWFWLFGSGFPHCVHSWFSAIKYSSSVRACLSAQKLNDNLVLTWTNAGFNLQAASAPMGDFTNILGATSPYTNSMHGSQGFFRLIAN